jgi:DNA-directed RNA polymerase beta subunit
MIGQDTAVNKHEQLERRDFARIPTIIDLPNLIEVQQKSYARFFAAGAPTLRP